MKNLFRKLGFGLGTMKISLDRPNFFLDCPKEYSRGSYPFALRLPPC